MGEDREEIRLACRRSRVPKGHQAHPLHKREPRTVREVRAREGDFMGLL